MINTLFRFPDTNDLRRIPADNGPIGNILCNNSTGTDDGTMADSTAAGKNNRTGADPDIAGDVQRRGCLATLMAHGNVSTCVFVPTTQEENILPHHQVIVDGDNPVEGFEVLADTDLVADGEVLPAAEIGASLHNQFPALVGIVLPEHVPANRPANTAGQFAKDRSRGFGKETGEPVVQYFVKQLLKDLPGDVDGQQPLRSYIIMGFAT